VAEQRASASAAEPRVSTGHPPLDTMLDGGLVAHRPYLVVGPAGTGKTTLALQFLCEGVRRGERCLLVTLEEPPNEVRMNHRNLGPDLGRVEVFDAIPDVMRYERVPFKDIASVREVVPFESVPSTIRKTPELSGVEVTITALEQMLRSEVHKKGYTRLVIDSLTALEYFCMKGFDPIGGAQSFLRFLADLRTTSILTVESPLEDADTPERMLARGEIRLFRWELEGRTVRAVGVEKFRGSSHDVRLHPYRIGPHGIDVKLDVTISRDTRQILEPTVAVVLPSLAAAEPIATLAPLSEAVRDLVRVGGDTSTLREEVEAALDAMRGGRMAELEGRVSRISSLAISLAETRAEPPPSLSTLAPEIAATYRRIAQRAEAARAGLPPTRLPDPDLLEEQLAAVLGLIPVTRRPGPAAAPAPVEPAPPPGLPSAAAPRSEGPMPRAPIERPRPPRRAPPRPEEAPTRSRPAPPAGRGLPEPPPLPSRVPSGTSDQGPAAPPEPRPPEAGTGPAVPAPSSPPPAPGASSPPPMPTMTPPPLEPAPSPAAERAAVTGTAKKPRRKAARKPESLSDAGGEAAAAPPAKTRRKTVRKRKAPTVIAATAEAPPAPPPAEPSASPAPPAASPGTPGAAEPPEAPPGGT
jgi:KaiC/GvpD/RAD55 family RecA-like ATPase